MEVMQHLAAGGVCYSSVRERWESQAETFGALYQVQRSAF